jgi:Zn-dependent protease
MWRDDEQPQIFIPPAYGRRQVVYLDPEPGPVTSGREILDLTIAVLALALIFSMPVTQAALVYGWGLQIIVLFYALCMISVMVSIFPHELAHKFVARRYGYWAEFRRSDTWLAIGIVTSFLGWGFAAPGAVMIEGRVTTEHNGKISAAGPLTNAVIGFAFLPIALVLDPSTLAAYIAQTTILISVVLGIFNMLPIWIFDGRKVWAWSRPVYLGLLAALVVLLVLGEKFFHFYGIL